MYNITHNNKGVFMITLRLDRKDQEYLIEVAAEYKETINRKMGDIVYKLLTDMEPVDGAMQRMITIEERSVIEKLCAKVGKSDVLELLEESRAA
jgi:hypothetical protein